MGLLRLSHERWEVTPDVSVREAARIMAESHIDAIAVRKGGAIVGVFGECDLVKRVVAGVAIPLRRASVKSWTPTSSRCTTPTP